MSAFKKRPSKATSVRSNMICWHCTDTWLTHLQHLDESRLGMCLLPIWSTNGTNSQLLSSIILGYLRSAESGSLVGTRKRLLVVFKRRARTTRRSPTDGNVYTTSCWNHDYPHKTIDITLTTVQLIHNTSCTVGTIVQEVHAGGSHLGLQCVRPSASPPPPGKFQHQSY